MDGNMSTLKSEVSGNLAKSVGEIAKWGYVIPLYQRSFAWGEKEIQQLVQDVYESSLKDEIGSYFIGSLVLFKRSEVLFEVIDGQQRLTVISLMLKYLYPSEYRHKFLSYDSREDVNRFLDFYHGLDDFQGIESKYGNESIKGAIPDYFSAVSFIDEAPLTPGSDNPIRLKDLTGEARERFASYFRDNVKMVMVDMPQSTDVASYFEIMNNRGVQLQHHEVLKSLLMSRINLDSKEAIPRMQRSFAEIWDACAEMDIPVQKSIAKEKRELLFGKEYDSLHLDNIEVMNPDSVSPDEKGQDLNTILGETDVTSDSFTKDEEKEENASEGEFKAIIDFPNFLMHVLKLKYNELYITANLKGQSVTDGDGEDYGIPLHEKYLLDVYDLIKDQVDPIDFIRSLLHYRVVFDKFVVRLSESKDEDNLKWALRRVKKYSSNKGYDRVDNHNNTFTDEIQPFVVKAISMLQVTHRQRRYKNFLNSILSWFKDTDTIDGASYLDKLNGLILKEFERNDTYKPLVSGFEYDGESLSLGTGTPHFLFNFIDYLYWTAWKKGLSGYEEVKYVKDFDYSYWNSVEHHMPHSFEQKKGKSPKMIDSLGNLCLISKSMNSRLNAEEPVGKARQYYKEGFAPLRRIIYLISKDGGNWDEEQIRNHYNNIVSIVKDRRHILGLDSLFVKDRDVIRAMFCLKDIGIYDGSYRSGERWNFLKGASQAKDTENTLISWRVENPDKTWKDFIEEKLKDPAHFKDDDGNYEEWRMLFVKYPFLLDYCEQGKFGWEEDGNYISMIKRARYGPYSVKEMRSFILGEKLDKFKAEVYADGIHIPVEITEQSGPNLHIWIEAHTSNWKYEIRLPAGVHKESSILMDKGWEKNENGHFFNPQMPYLVEDQGYGIVESIELAYKAAIGLMKELQFTAS